jgi:hypothetical protein
MEAEHLGQGLDRLLVTFGDVDPHEPVLALEQHLQLLDTPLFSALI